MNESLKQVIKRIPLLGGVASRVHRKLLARAGPFPGSAAYWNRRYSKGGDSGSGSRGLLAAFKADVVNDFVAAHRVQTVVEFGCGDGNQLGLARYPTYLGVDVSSTAISRCKKLFASDPRKSFCLMSEYGGDKADLALSLDVIYHLTEDDVFERYMRTLFAAAARYVIIYSSNVDDDSGSNGRHVRHRKFTRWVEQHLINWKLVEHVRNRYRYDPSACTGSFAEFFVYQARPRNAAGSLQDEVTPAERRDGYRSTLDSSAARARPDAKDGGHGR